MGDQQVGCWPGVIGWVFRCFPSYRSVSVADWLQLAACHWAISLCFFFDFVPSFFFKPCDAAMAAPDGQVENRQKYKKKDSPPSLDLARVRKRRVCRVFNRH